MIDKKPIEKDTHIHCYMSKTNRSGNTTPPYPQIHEIDHSTITNSRSNMLEDVQEHTLLHKINTGRKARKINA